MTDSLRHVRQDRLQTALQGLSPDDRATARLLVSLLARFERLGGPLNARFGLLSEFYALGPRLQRAMLLACERRLGDDNNPGSPGATLGGARPAMRRRVPRVDVRQAANDRARRSPGRPRLVGSSHDQPISSDARVDAVALRWAVAVTQLDIPGMISLIAEDATLVDESASLTLSGALAFIDYLAAWTEPFDMTNVVAEVRRDAQTGTWVVAGDCHIYHRGHYDSHWGASPPTGASFVLRFTHHCAITPRGITHLRIHYDPAVLRRGLGLQR